MLKITPRKEGMPMNDFMKDVASVFMTPRLPGNSPAIVRTFQTDYGPRMVSLRVMENGEVMAVVTETRDGLKHSVSLHSKNAGLLHYFINSALEMKELQ